MKALLLTESLGSGGAERQIALLAVGLRGLGVDVRVVTYSDGDFYGPLLERGGVECESFPFGTRAERVLGVRRTLRDASPDVVVSFLQGPNVYAELASWPRRRWGLVVSERTPQSSGRPFDWRRVLHGLADVVTTNSHTNRLMLEKAAPALAGRVTTLYNAVDLEAFRPGPSLLRARDGSVRLAVAATCHRMKNMGGLLEAIRLLRGGVHTRDVTVDWYGAIPEDRVSYETTLQRVNQLGLARQFRFHPPTKDIGRVFRDADAVILPSFYEGLPNAVCEAMACGRPILMSAVCDAGNLVKDGANGFLFDPTSPADIADAIGRLAVLPDADRERMGAESRAMAERMFDPGLFAVRYRQVLERAAERRPADMSHWVPEIPATALRSLRSKSRWGQCA